MKTKGGSHYTVKFLLLLSLLLFPALSRAAVMNDYCVVPAFIQQAIPSNLLLMIDNSSSMYDLEYADVGKTDPGTGAILRQPYYCYDETYSSTHIPYAGYFDIGPVSSTDTAATSPIYYTYDPANNYFVRSDRTVTPFPGSGSCTYYIANTLCVTPDSSGKIGTVGSTFAASSNYLNWLTSSKFDIEKQILTGGKEVTKLCSGTDQACNTSSDCASGTCTAVATSFLQAESRGCVGQGFIKTPLRSDFVNFSTLSDPNTTPFPGNMLGITFSIRGPVDSANKSNPSRGGQTYIEIYQGNDNNAPCQDAINKYYDPTQNQTTVSNAIQACINYVPTTGQNKSYCSKSTSTTCTTDNDSISGTSGGCATGSTVTSCLQDRDCSTHITANGTCTNTTNGGSSISCTSDANCAAGSISGGTCTNNSSISCTTDSQCGIKTNGTCAGGNHRSCSSNSDCTGNNGPCNGIVYYACGAMNPDSTGTCTNPKPTYSNYACNNPAATTVNNGPCINPTQNGAVNTKIALSETIQTCWTYLSRGQAIGTGDYNRLIGGNKCDSVYASWGICTGNNAASCSTDADCTGSTGPCIHGPGSILPGNPAMICGNDYLGKYCSPSSWTGTTTTCTWDTSNPTAIETDYENFCNAQQPTVIDPTDTAASSTNYEQLPTLVGGMGLQGQLGSPIGTIPVRVQLGSGTHPTGLIQQFGDQIRIGAMSFNFNGSKSEATAGSIAKPRVCDSAPYTRLCAMNADCTNYGGTCLSATDSASHNLDGGQVIYPAGLGHCATMQTPAKLCAVSGDCLTGNTCINGFCGAKHSTVCATDTSCSSGDTCMTDGVGTHAAGLINTIDSIRANAWTPFAEGFYNAIGYFARTSSGTSRTDVRINSVNASSTDFTSAASAPKDYNENLNPSQYRCQQNYVLLITDGSSTADQNSAVSTLASTYSSAALVPPGYTSAPPLWDSACTYYAGSSYLPIMSYIAQNRNIADFTTTPLNGRDKITTYVVYNSPTSNGQSGECNSKSMLSDTAKNGGTDLYMASDPESLSTTLGTVFQQIAAQSASGTAASILSNSAGSGANILQALFYPTRQFGNTKANWIGEMLNLWYYVDPFLNNSTVREDTGYTSGNHTLDLKNNYVLSFDFDSNPQDSATYNQAVVKKYQDVNGNGTTLSQIFTGADVASQGFFSTDHLQSIWRAGAQLQATLPSSRSIYTTCLTGSCGSSNLMRFSLTNDSALQPYLQTSSSETDNIINWVLGSDVSGYRRRTVSYTYRGTTTTQPWKLGDIISSTPKTQSSGKLNTYDLPPPAGYTDQSYSAFVTTASNNYKNRGMAYVGANDGMLHAFRMGTLTVTPSGTTKATLTGDADSSGNKLGSEQWAFIPQNALPYLRYLTCTANGSDPLCNSQEYGHLYFVDGSTTVVDASIGTPAGCSDSYYDCPKDVTSGTNWRTVLIGGMGIGGASRNVDSDCVEDKMSPDGTTRGTCVKSPADGKGYSSYFALDVTNQTFDSNGNLAGLPKFMWEFSAPSGLGFATSGAAIVRISARDASNNPDKSKNGRWFAVFGSGPTGPIDKARHQFLGTSDQNLKIYVVDLNASGPWVSDGTSNSNYWVIDSGIPYAFASSVSSAPIDTDRWKADSVGNYQDNALYFGYVQANTSTITASTTWTNGGVLRLVTANSAGGEDPNPAHWVLSPVIRLNEPVTTGIAKLQDRGNHNLWLYFGTGRYFYGQDDMATQRHLFAVKEPCYTSANTLNMTCTNTIDATSSLSDNLADQSDALNPNDPTSKHGWYITLESAAGASGAERSITDAVALTNGAVFFSTYKPTSDLCAMGGNSFLWAVKYDTGLVPSAAALKGKVLFQLSTGEFKQVSLSDSSTFTGMGGRRTGSNWTGKPPSDPPPIISNTNLKPVKKILHIQEK